MLSLRGVSLSFGGLQAIDNFDLELGERVVGALIGANGAGKTSVLNVINRFYRPDSGSVHYDDVDVLALKPHQVIETGISRSFQNVALFNELSAFDNLLVGADHLDRPHLLTNLFRLPKARRHHREASRRAERVLEFLGIVHLRNRRAGELPFGERKLVDMGRALTADPKLLLLDEPAAGIPDSEHESLAHLIRRIPDEWGASVLLIDHSMELVLGVASHVVAMDFGAKIAEGSPDAVRSDPRVIAAYLGQDADQVDGTEAE
ncbi:MAG: ABC transporter ATP-binding protein [Solirubrobacteraceae bacterium]